MANSEACALYIEQEIKSGLDEGKTPYAIGKDISGLVAKLFETKINALTIKQKAMRIKKKIIDTNVSNDLTNEKQKKTEQIQDFKWGGSRKNAGRKPTIKDRIADANTMKINDRCGFDRDIFYAQPENKARLAYAEIDCGLSSITETLKKIDDTDCLLSYIDMTFCDRWDFVFEKIEDLVTKCKKKGGKGK